MVDFAFLAILYTVKIHDSSVWRWTYIINALFLGGAIGLGYIVQYEWIDTDFTFDFSAWWTSSAQSAVSNSLVTWNRQQGSFSKSFIIYCIKNVCLQEFMVVFKTGQLAWFRVQLLAIEAAVSFQVYVFIFEFFVRGNSCITSNFDVGSWSSLRANSSRRAWHAAIALLCQCG